MYFCCVHHQRRCHLLEIYSVLHPFIVSQRWSRRFLVAKVSVRHTLDGAALTFWSVTGAWTLLRLRRLLLLPPLPPGKQLSRREVVRLSKYIFLTKATNHRCGRTNYFVCKLEIFAAQLYRSSQGGTLNPPLPFSAAAFLACFACAEIVSEMKTHIN